MTTYYTTADWDEFSTFVKCIKPIADNLNTGFLYSGDQIFIRTLDLVFLKLIQKRYNLTIVETPDTFFTDKRDWNYMGNTHLFTTVIK